jgi:hypothetical protein
MDFGVGRKPILTQHRRVDGKRVDDRARLEEIGPVEADRDAALEVDTAASR